MTAILPDEIMKDIDNQDFFLGVMILWAELELGDVF